MRSRPAKGSPELVSWQPGPCLDQWLERVCGRSQLHVYLPLRYLQVLHGRPNSCNGAPDSNNLSECPQSAIPRLNAHPTDPTLMGEGAAQSCRNSWQYIRQLGAPFQTSLSLATATSSPQCSQKRSKVRRWP